MHMNPEYFADSNIFGLIMKFEYLRLLYLPMTYLT